MTQDEAYAQAAYIDKKIGELLARHPLNRRTYRGWKVFIRSVRTTLSTLELVINTYDRALRDPTKKSS